ncbi:MAG: allantoicase [Actinomycetota bacterium]|nr:allantoicase [Actinomycetota bacterium]
MSDITELPDLAARRLGGMVLAANDEFFAPKENLIAPEPPTFDPHRYTDRGKEMDGWETRRRREPGHDWCVVRLGVPGIVRGVVVDTSFFRGNFPDRCSLEGLVADDDDSAFDHDAPWQSLLAETPLEGDARNEFAIDGGGQVTHLRLNIHPDGGVARLRVHGEPLPDLRRLVSRAGEADLALIANGGLVIGASDTFFASPHNLTTVGDARDMSDGWETRRRRGPGHDWAIVRLAAEADIDRVEVDTTNYKGNHPDTCSVEACVASGDRSVESAEWFEVLPSARLRPHARHLSDVSGAGGPATHVRLNIHPDGGVARLRVHGRVTDRGWRQWGTRWLNAEPAARCEAELLRCCGSNAWAQRIAAGRPYASFDDVLAAADREWNALGPDDWLKAFAAHPRVGERSAEGWSRAEQESTANAPVEVLSALEEGNRRYEERFGHVFLVNATGKSAQGMLEALHERMANDPDTELRVAAEEQRAITRLRLEKLVRPPGSGG